MTQRRARAVLFDLDGTLYAKPRGFELRIAAQLWREFTPLRHLNAARNAVRGRVFDDSNALQGAFLTQLARMTGWPESRVARWYDERFFQAFVDVLRRHAQPRPGLIDLLARLRRSGLRLGVLSDHGWILERLAVLQIDASIFDVLASSEESGALKPNVPSFLAAADALNVPVEHVLFVGDREDTDARGARDAGMQFLGIRSKHLPSGRPWSAVVEELSALVNK